MAADAPLSAGLAGLLFILASSLPLSLRAGDYYVAPAGNDAAVGSIYEPFQTIQKGASLLKPGDRLILRAGRYHEHVIFKDLKGSEEHPIVICTLDGEKAVLDGTVAVASIAEGKWEPHRDGIYRIKVNRDIWQLIADGLIQTTARWPNAFWHDDSIFDLKHWAMGNEQDEWYDYPQRSLTGHTGVMGNTPDEKAGIDLKKLSFDLTGAVAVLNIANYDTYSYPVIKHDIAKGPSRSRSRKRTESSTGQCTRAQRRNLQGNSSTDSTSTSSRENSSFSMRRASGITTRLPECSTIIPWAASHPTG